MTNLAAPSYQVRRLQPQDAAGIRALVERVYGTTYAHRELYHPEELLRLNNLGELVSVVVVDEAGQVVGHYALERPHLGAIAETGEAMILPGHRGQHLFPRLRGLVEEEARRLGLVGLCGRPLTSHIRSQKVYQEFHCHPTGLELARFGWMRNDLAAGAPQLLSALMYFKYLRTPGLTVYHLPHRHRDLVRKIVERLQRPVTFATAAPAAEAGTLQSEYQAQVQAAFIQVRVVGRDSPGQVAQELARLRAQGALAVFLRLPLAQPGTDELCIAAEHQGFFFSGIDPQGDEEGDILQLQFLTTALDLKLLQIDEPFAREIAAHVAAEQRGSAVTLQEALLLTGGGILAGVANTLAGGGSSVSLPLLLGCGLSAPAANGTNHVAHLVGALARLSVFARSNTLSWPLAWRLAVPTAVGSLCGAWLATVVPAQDLRTVMVAGGVGAALLLLVNPKRFLHGDAADRPRIGALQIIVLTLAGAWSGFVLLWGGTFQLLALTLCIGFGLTRALAVKAMISLLTMVVALPVFIGSDQVALLPGLCLAAGTVIGSVVAARLAVTGRARAWLYGFVVLLAWGEAIYLIVQPAPHSTELPRSSLQLP